MSNCCGSKNPPKQKKANQPEIKGRENQESFWEKLLKSLGLKSSEDKMKGGE